MVTLNYLCSECECNPHRVDCKTGRRQSMKHGVAEEGKSLRGNLARLEQLNKESFEVMTASEKLYLQQSIDHLRRASEWMQTFAGDAPHHD